MSSEEAPLPGVVYDCMVFLQGAARATGPASACLDAVQNERVELFLSPRILAEIQDVLTRPKLQRKFPILTTEYVDDFLQSLLRKAIVITDVPMVFRYERDPKDEPYVNLALVAKAQYIVSRDNDLLDLMDENREAGRDFRAQFPALTILDPVEFLRRLYPPLQSESAQAPEQEQGD